MPQTFKKKRTLKDVIFDVFLMKDYDFFPIFDYGSSFVPKDYMAYTWGLVTTNWDGRNPVAGKVSAQKIIISNQSTRMRKGPLVVWGIQVYLMK